MRADWKRVKLSEITEMIKRGISPKYVEENGVLVVNQKCIRDNVLSLREARFHTLEKKVANEKMLVAGDVLVNSTGTGTLGRTAPVKRVTEPITVDSHVTIVRANKKLDGGFLGYLLAFHENEIVNMGKGATNQTELSSSDLGTLSLYIPESLPTQRRIASILSAYDDLIENNLRRIALLEEMARQTYEEWFVRMRFPGWEEAEWDGELPRGWEKVKLGEVVKTSSGGTPSRKMEEEYYSNGTIPWVRTGELRNFMLIESEEKITGAGLKNSSAKLFSENTVLLAMYGNTIGETSFLTFEASTNQACCAFLVEDKTYLSYFIHQYLLYNKEQVLSYRMGAAQENISQTIIQNIEIIMPDVESLISFESNISLVYSQIKNLLQQNRFLREARDILLPRLMSGVVEL